MLAECPVCHRPLRWTYLLRTTWSQWRCDGCGSLLGIDRKRRMLAIAPYAGSVAVIVFAIPGVGFGDFVILPVAVGTMVCFYLLFDRAVVLERCGLRCKGCGYDLRGQVALRCPECGGALNDTQRVRLETGRFPPAVVRRRRTRPGWIVLVLVLLGTVTITAFVTASYLAARARAVRQQAAAAAAAAGAGSGQSPTPQADNNESLTTPKPGDE